MKRVYYNDNDPKSCAWLRELITAGQIPDGVVDERSILDVQPADLAGFVQCHFFAGIGGWSLALNLAGWPIDRPVWTGSCPCQPYSAAGKGKGDADARNLWPTFFKLIKACRPPAIFGEQVASAAVIGKVMQNVRRKQTAEYVQEAQQGRIARGVPGLREPARSQDEALAVREEAGLSSSTTPDASGLCAGKRCPEEGEGQGNPIQSGMEGYSGAHRSGQVRSDGTDVRSDNPKGMECAIARPDNSQSGLHQGKHESSSLCAQHDGERLGREFDHHNCGSDSEETVLARVERIVATLGRKPEEAIVSVWLDGIRDDLEGAGYTCGACVLAASSVSAPHIRQRLYWCGLADPNGGNPGAEREQRGGGLVQQPQDQAVGGVEHSAGDGREQRRATSGGWGVERGCGDSGMGDTNEPGSQGRVISGHGAGERAVGPSGLGFWDDYELIPCADGKARRIESGSAPLVAKFSGVVVPGGDPGVEEAQNSGEARVMRLRGYGNSITVPVAAQFIQAVMA